MIVRIQGEGQWELDGSQLDALNKIDNQIVEVLSDHDNVRFDALLHEMLDHVRRNGRRLGTDELVESELILPPSDATMAEVQKLFADEGLIAG